MAKQRQKGGHTSAEIATNHQQPTGKRARSREARNAAEAASKRKAALRRLAKGTRFLTSEDRTILGDRLHR